MNDTYTCGGLCETCGLTSQSPIDISTAASDLSDEDYSDFSFSLGYQIVQEGSIVNNGHTST